MYSPDVKGLEIWRERVIYMEREFYIWREKNREGDREYIIYV